MGHVFAMFLDHISQGFVMAEVPTWEIHFPGMVPAKRQLCSPIVSMILQLICKWSETCLEFLPAQLIQNRSAASAVLSLGDGEALGLIPRSVLSYFAQGRLGGGHQNVTDI